jgi:putative oxidoreductase
MDGVTPDGGTMIDVEKAPYGALLLRVSMGVLFILHGVYLKAFVFGMAGTGKFFATLGLPEWFAWIVMLYETIGGLALVLGVYVRWVALFLGIHLLVASYLTAGNGWLFSNKGGGYEFPLFWAVACFALALLGAGAHSLQSAVPSKGVH